jgi:hypothetical protein
VTKQTVQKKPQTQLQLAQAFLNGAVAGAKGAMSIEGDEVLSFGWYPIARRVGTSVWLRRQMYSEATARQIKTVRRALVTQGYVEVGKIDEATRALWWSWEIPIATDASGAGRNRVG